MTRDQLIYGAVVAVRLILPLVLEDDRVDASLASYPTHRGIAGPDRLGSLSNSDWGQRSCIGNYNGVAVWLSRNTGYYYTV